MSYTATYDPADNRLRLYSPTRLDPETYARVKAAGFSWAPKQECFYAPMWTPAREDVLLELAGEIDDEDTTLVERAEQRAERFEDYHDKRSQEAARTHKAVEGIMDGIPLGQPILVGHHSEQHARKDAQRIEDGLRKAVKLWDTAQYWQQRAKGALQHARYKERPEVRARRIKTLEAELRKQRRILATHEKFTAAWQVEPCTLERAKAIANHDYLSRCYPLADFPREPPASQYEGEMGLWSALDGGIITAEQARTLALAGHAIAPNCHALRWLAHFENRIAYEKALLGEVGGIVTDQVTPEKGGACMCWASPHRGWSYIVRVNKVSVSVLDNWGNGGKNFTRVIPFDKLSKVLTAQEVQDLRDTGFLIEASNKVGFYRRNNLENLPDHVRDLEPTKEDPTLADTVQAVSVAHGLDTVPVVPSLTPEAVADLKRTLKAGVQVVTVPQLFPTPPALANRMVALASIRRCQRVLEPSAGTGRLLDAITRVLLFESSMEGSVLAIEENEALALALAAKRSPRVTVTHADFLTCDPADFEPFDAICMNPPFAKGQDTAHVLHALQFLAPGGTLVAITSAMAGQRSTQADRAFQQTMDDLDATRELLPPDTFHDSGTAVHTALWVVRTPPPAPSPAERACREDWTAQGVSVERQDALLAAIDAKAQPGTPIGPFLLGVPSPGPTLATLALALDQAATVEHAQRTRDRLELTLTQKQAPRTAQAAPCGMFEQVQQSLF